MAKFKYVGSLIKSNGKVDVKVGNYSFADVTPDLYDIEVPDGSKEEKYLEFAKDAIDGSFLYIKQS